jgi:ZIP family zinc transporter
LGDCRAARPQLKVTLNAIATGVLLFLFWDVLSHAWEPVDKALGQHQISDAVLTAAVLASAFGIGLLGLVGLDRRLSRTSTPTGPGAAAVGELTGAPHVTAPSRLAMMIAAGIGLHNFAEGLAIGNSAAAGDLSLALMLVIGFGLHNATEGFGIVAPPAGQRPSWGFLALLGLIGGGPTLLGTLVGQRFTNDTLSVAFLGLAAGSILYVIIELLAVCRASTLKTLTSWAIFAGLVLGFATDAILTAAGA